jgi:hypothetical protein
MTYHVGHAAHAGAYDRKGLTRYWLADHRSPRVGAEIALSLVESELAMAWYGRRRPHPSVRSASSDEARAYRLSCIRGLVSSAVAVAAVARRKPVLPVTWGRS